MATTSKRPNFVFLGGREFLVRSQAGLKHAVRKSLGEDYDYMKKLCLIDYGKEFFYPAVVTVTTYYTGIERAVVHFQKVSAYKARLQQKLDLLKD